METDPLDVSSQEQFSTQKVRKRKSKGGRYCCVVGCHNNQRLAKCQGTIFYSFPGHREPNRRNLWIRAVNRENADRSPWEPNKHSALCSAHFIGGKKVDDKRSPDFVPSIFPKPSDTNASHGKYVKRKKLENSDDSDSNISQERKVESDVKGRICENDFQSDPDMGKSDLETNIELSDKYYMRHDNGSLDIKTEPIEESDDDYRETQNCDLDEADLSDEDSKGGDNDFQRDEFRDIAQVDCFDDRRYLKLQARIGSCEIQLQIARKAMKKNLGRRDFTKFKNRVNNWNKRKWMALNELNIFNEPEIDGESKYVQETLQRTTLPYDAKKLDKKRDKLGLLGTSANNQKEETFGLKPGNEYSELLIMNRGCNPSDKELKLLDVIKECDNQIKATRVELDLYAEPNLTNELIKKSIMKSIARCKNKRRDALKKLGLTQYVTDEEDNSDAAEFDPVASEKEMNANLSANESWKDSVNDFVHVEIKQEPEETSEMARDGKQNDHFVLEGAKEESASDDSEQKLSEKSSSDKPSELDVTNKRKKKYLDLDALQSDIEEHIKAIKSGEVWQMNEWPCYLCSRVLASQQMFVQHIKSYHYNLCATCNFLAPGSEQLQRHIHAKHKHKEAKEYFCHLCKYSCFGKSALTCHQKKCHQNAEFQCDCCSEKFDSQVALDSHSLNSNCAFEPIPKETVKQEKKDSSDCVPKNVCEASNKKSKSRMDILFEASLRKSYNMWNAQSEDNLS